VIRAVFDANIIVSGLPAAAGPLAELFAKWRAGDFQIVMAEPLMTEVRTAWEKPYWRAHFPERLQPSAERLLRQYAEWTQITENITGIAAHRADDVILSIAVSAKVDYLVTGDKRFRSRKGYADIRFCGPLEFLALLDQG
jgi:predicted nucleic acid-binding protein